VYWALFAFSRLVNHDGTIELVAQSIDLVPPGQHPAQTGFAQGGYADLSAKRVETHEITNQQAEIDEFEQFLQREIESDRWICKVQTPPVHHQPDQPPLTSDEAPSQQTQVPVAIQAKERPSIAESIEKVPSTTQPPTSVNSTEPESVVNQWVRRFRCSCFPDYELERQIEVGLPFTVEAARRVLEERAQTRADNLMAPCF
jgi:hypothetical protein